MLKVKKVCLISFSFCLIVVVLISIMNFSFFDRNFYHQQYSRHNTANEMNISEEDLWKMTEGLLDFLQEKRNDLHIEIKHNNQFKNAFNEKEITHMEDVLFLYQRLKFTQRFSLFLSCFLLLILLICDYRYVQKEIFTSWKVACVSLLAIFSGLMVVVINDFDVFWTQFHHLLFRNDLWILNPQTDLLISMVPQSFFFALVTRITGYGLLFLGFSILFLRKVSRCKK